MARGGHKGRLTLRPYPISYPGIPDPKGWFEPAKPCASQRLFFPYLIHGTDRVICVDTDVLFLRPIDDAWRLFERFAPEQLAALAPETESHEDSWYRRFAQHPYFAPFGLDTGFELMDLAKMRERRWRERLAEYAAKYAEKTVWVDQDLQNILFHDDVPARVPRRCRRDRREHREHAPHGSAARDLPAHEDPNAGDLRLPHAELGVVVDRRHRGGRLPQI